MALNEHTYMNTARIRLLWPAGLSDKADTRLLYTSQMAAQMIDEYCGVSFVPAAGDYAVTLRRDDTTPDGQIVRIPAFNKIDTITVAGVDYTGVAVILGESGIPCTEVGATAINHRAYRRCFACSGYAWLGYRSDAVCGVFGNHQW